MSYCPKCKSLLYPDDVRYIMATGVCSGCVSWDRTPGRIYRKALEEYEARQERRNGGKRIPR